MPSAICGLKTALRLHQILTVVIIIAAIQFFPVWMTIADAQYALSFDGQDDFLDAGSGIDLAEKSFAVEFWANRASMDKLHVALSHSFASTVLAFDGSDDYVEIPAGIDIADRSFTVEFWAKRAAPDASQAAIGQGEAIENKGLCIGFRDDNRFVFGFCDNDLLTPEGRVYTDTAWHHWACVYAYDENTQTGERRIYRDGEPLSHDSANAYQGTGPLYIGKFADFGNFNGQLDEVRVWDAARTPQEMNESRNKTLAGTEARLVAYWRLDDGAGSLEVLDSSSGGHPGALQNMDPDVSWGRRPLETTGKRHALYMGFRDSNVFTFSFLDKDLDTPREWTENGWHHWACVYDQSTGERRIYRDGELTAEDTVSEPYQGRGVLFVGNGSVDGHFHGQMDEVRIWLTSRTREEIRASLKLPITEMSSAAGHWMRGNETGLGAYWRFDEGSGLDAADSGPDNRTAVLINMNPDQAWVAGIVHDLPLPGQLALRFSGEDIQYVEVPNESDFDITTALTVEAWVKVNRWNRAHQTILSKGTWALRRYRETEKIVFATGGLSSVNLVSVTEFIEGRWYHLAAVCEGPHKYLYVDGELDQSVTGLTGSLSTNDRKVWIGNDPATKDRPWNGALDEVRIWKGARSEVLIKENYDRRLSGHEPGLLGCWRFDVPDETCVGDSSEAKHHGYPAGMSLRNFVDNPDLSLREPFSGTYAFQFDGTDDYVEVPHSDGLEPASLTLETWMKPEGDGWRTILMKGEYGYGLSIDGENKLRFWRDDNPENTLVSSASLVNGRWQHVAVVVDNANETTTFYVNGKAAGTYTEAAFNTREGDGPLYFGREGSGCTNCNYYEGWLYQVIIWDQACSPGEINYFMNRAVPAGTSGLAGLWDFGQATATAVPELSGKATKGDIVNGGISGIGDSGFALTAADLPSGLNLGRNPGAAGLWIGQIEINKVTEVRGNTDSPTEAAHPFDMRILLHVDALGQVRLLRSVTLMQTMETDAEGEIRKVLVTDDTRLADFDGVVRRDGKLVGIRLGSLAYDFDPTRNELPLIGGLGEGFSAAGTLTLDENHPTNPFRHKYHPDHKKGRRIVRDIALTFHKPDDEKPGTGLFRLEGDYRETIKGLQKSSVKIEGALSVERISMVSTLNE